MSDNQLHDAVLSTLKKMQNPNSMAEGVIMFKRLDRNLKGSKAVRVQDREGIIVFSLSDLPLKVVFVTENNVSIERRTENEVYIAGKHKIEAAATPQEVLDKAPPTRVESAVQGIKGFFARSEEAITDVINPEAKKREQVAFLREKYATQEEEKKKGILSKVKKDRTRTI